MEILFVYSDGVLIGLSFAGRLVCIVLGSVMFTMLATYLAARKDGRLGDADLGPFTYVFVSYLFGLVISALVMSAIRYWQATLAASATLLILAGLPYATYRLGRRLHDGHW